MADVTPILIKDLAAQTTLADTDYFIVGGADAKKITVAQMKEALGINKLNTKSYSLVSYNSSAIQNINIQCKKSGGVVSVSGYFELISVIGSGVNFAHLNPELDPDSTTYFLIAAASSLTPKYGKLDTDGYLKCDDSMPAGYYFLNFSYLI